MYLHRLHLNLQNREARRDLADPYQMHSTLCRAFSAPEQPCPTNAFLWRLEPETNAMGHPRILVQSWERPNWRRIEVPGWFAGDPGPAVDLAERLDLENLQAGRRFRFRLRANPSITKEGKRLGLMRLDAQEAWILRKGRDQHGFDLPTFTGFDLNEAAPPRVEVRVSQEQMLRGRPRSGHEIRIFSVLYEGILIVREPVRFRQTIQGGIGHGKTLGLGMLSVVPLP
jgi:CRISPR system Cascade subunit CasE